MTLDELLDKLVNDDSSSELLAKTRTAFANVGVDYVKPNISSVKQIHAGISGRHTGIYFIFERVQDPAGFIYYYVGIATKGNTIHNRFQPHYAKLTVNLRAMYGNVDSERKETRWQFPKNWRKGIKQHFLNNPDDIPDYWTGRQRKELIQPANLDYAPQFKKNVDTLPVLVWDLNHLDARTIDSLETALVREFRPVFNGSKNR